MPVVKAGHLSLVFTDESYIHPSHAIKKYWFHIEDKDRVFGSPEGKGRRIILVRFGSDEGWIEGGQHVWECTGKETDTNGDYHGNVNGEWWNEMFEKVCQALQDRRKKVVFIMDNARYHKMVGNEELDKQYFEGRKLATALKAQLEKYLKAFNIPYQQGHKVEELRKLARAHYQKDGIRSLGFARKYGHDILFTPPYWPQLQPMELAWGVVKNYVAHNRGPGDYTVESTLRLVKEGFASVTAVEWKGMIDKAYTAGRTVWSEIISREARQPTVPYDADESDESEDESDMDWMKMRWM